jgi:DNA polymerase III alpha subunit
MFVRACSGWSLGCGLIRPDLLLDWAGRSAVRSVCQADYDNLYGAIEFYELALQRGIRPILGAVITDRPADRSRGSCPLPVAAADGRVNGGSHLLSPIGRTKLIVQRLRALRYVAIACNQAGYENLCRLITERHMAGSFDLAEAAGRCQYGLVFLVEDASVLARLARCVEPARLRAEIGDYGDDASRGRSYRLLESAAALGIEPVASHAAYFAAPGDHPLHRILRAVVLNQLASRMVPEELVPPGAWLAPVEHLRDRLGRYGKRPIRNAERLIEQCDLKLPLGVPHFPKVPLKDGETACARLCRLVWEGLARRYKRVPPEAVPRLKHELHVITKMGFADYFLVVHEIVQFARSRNIGCVGRGSAADSLVTYCLGISDVDPLRYKLHFERFLNESRTDYPDIDLDFDWRRRDEVIRFVYEHWGADHVAMISTQHFYKARSAFRDAARALGMPTEKLNRLTGQLPCDEADNLRRAIATMPECRHFPMQDPQVARAVRIAERLAGLPRGLSVHVGGVVISRRELVCYSPIQPATKGIAITQYDMRAIEKVGLVKIDLLGHRSLAILADALDLVQRNHAVRVDLPSLPEDDPDTARVLASGRTIGCFQIESPGMRQLLQMLQAKDLQDVIHGLSLIRPGPSASGMKERFVKRKRGLEPVTYPHPAMKEVLAETYGVMLYQEDVMMVAAAVAGFTMSTGDSLRKALEKPDSREQMARLKATFMQGARQRGCDEVTAEHIWLLVSNFAAYSYNKAHACTYGKISYWCTYMKTHWPAEFMTGVLNNIGGYYSLAEYLEEARRLGVPILPPHVNASGLEFAAEPVAVQSVVPRRLNDRVSGVGHRVSGVGCRVSGVGHRASGVGCRVSGVGHRVSGVGCRVSGVGHRASGIGCRVSGIGCRVSGNGSISCCPPPPVVCPNPQPATRNPVVLRRIGIRVPLLQVRNLAEKTARAIVEQRGQRPFANLQDLLGRVRLSVEEARALIFSGACDGLGPSRPAMLWQLSIRLRQERMGASLAGEHASLFETPVRAGSLVGNSPPYAAAPGEDLPSHLLRDYDRARLMELERQYLSFSPGDHPMGAFGKALAGQDIIRSIDVGGFIGRLVTVAGVIVAMRRAVTRKRELMQFVTLEDRWGLVEVILFQDVYKQLGGTFDSFGPYRVQGVVQENLGSVVLVGRSVQRAIKPQPGTSSVHGREQAHPDLCG